jgi:hypothetical protein
MNEARSSESCRMVSVSPAVPSSTSWWATSPGSRTECTRTPSTLAPRAPGSSSVVASGSGPAPASARAAAINEAVRAAVPDGASTLPAWCSSITSTESKNRAACRANCIISTAPTPKFGAMSTCPGVSSSQPRTWSKRCSSNPLVPTTTAMPWSSANRMLSSTAPGWVKSTTTWAPASTSSAGWSPSSRRATSARSGAASTARHTSPPMRPRAPSTATRMSVTRAL